MTTTTVPTRAEILVPETLLKKRKSQEKAREQRASELRKRREVLIFLSSSLFTIAI